MEDSASVTIAEGEIVLVHLIKLLISMILCTLTLLVLELQVLKWMANPSAPSAPHHAFFNNAMTSFSSEQNSTYSSRGTIGTRA
ncbi:Protein GvpH 2 [Bienertia sinuspersici]